MVPWKGWMPHFSPEFTYLKSSILFQAELKGATASEYGLVFGVFELVVFLVSPLYGQHLNKIGPKFMFNSGIFTTGICAILFG